MSITRHKTEYWIKNSLIDVSEKEIDGEVLVHWHEFYEIELILDGEGIYNIDGNDYKIEKGSLFFMSPGSFHHINFTKESKLINIMFTLDICDFDFLYDIFFVDSYRAYKLSEYEINFIKTLVKEMQNAESEKFLYNLLNSVIGKIRELDEGGKDNIKKDYMQYAVLYIQNHFTENLTLKDVAKLLNYNQNYFGNKFKKYTGVCFKTYVLNLRFAFASNLLKNSKLSVTEICYACGFEDFSNFMVSFKARFGVTPKAYRQQKSHSV